jgi:hypothetical protein
MSGGDQIADLLADPMTSLTPTSQMMVSSNQLHAISATWRKRGFEQG